MKNMTLSEYYSTNSNMICHDLIMILLLATNVSCLLELGEKFCLQLKNVKRQLIMDMIDRFARDVRTKNFVNKTHIIDYRTKFRLYMQTPT